MKEQRVLVLIAMVLILAAPATSQSSPADGPWSGSIQCQVDLQQQGYSRHEVQTWTLAGNMPTGKNGDMQIYPATWTATGQGGTQRTLGPRASVAQWNLSVPATPATIAMFIRAQDKQFVIRIWQRPIPATNTLRGTRQFAENGIVQPGTINNTAKEWALPWILADPGAQISGKFLVPTESLGADLTPVGSAPNAECTYSFSSRVNADVGSLANAKIGASGLVRGQLVTTTADTPQVPPTDSQSGTSQSDPGSCASDSDIEAYFQQVTASLRTKYETMTQQLRSVVACAVTAATTPSTSVEQRKAITQQQKALEQQIADLQKQQQLVLDALAKEKQKSLEQSHKTEQSLKGEKPDCATVNLVLSEIFNSEISVQQEELNSSQALLNDAQQVIGVCSAPAMATTKLAPEGTGVPPQQTADVTGVLVTTTAAPTGTGISKTSTSGSTNQTISGTTSADGTQTSSSAATAATTTSQQAPVLRPAGSARATQSVRGQTTVSSSPTRREKQLASGVSTAGNPATNSSPNDPSTGDTSNPATSPEPSGPNGVGDTANPTPGPDPNDPNATTGPSSAPTGSGAEGRDDTPDPFSFSDTHLAGPFLDFTSNAVTITGINTDASISIPAGDAVYSINEGPYQSQPGTVRNGDTVCLRAHLQLLDTSRTFSVKVGTYTAEWTLTRLP